MHIYQAGQNSKVKVSAETGATFLKTYLASDSPAEEVHILWQSISTPRRTP